MRFEELIVSLGDDEARLPFHPQLTVLGPMDQAERTELVDTIVAATLGQRPGVALSYVDAQGQPGRTTSTGSVGADGAPGPSVLGAVPPDADQLRRAVVVTAPDLNLPAGRLDPRDQAELAAARAALDAVRSLPVETAPPVADPAIIAELATLDERLQDADEADARRAHFTARLRLADVEAELEVLDDLATTAEDDAQLIAATTRLTQLDQQRAAADSVADRARSAVRTAAAILKSPAHPGTALLGLDDTPDPMTAPFTESAKAWQRAAARVRTLEVAVSNHSTNDVDGEIDRRIPLLAPLDQDALWTAHHRVRDVERRFQAVTAAREAEEEEIPADVEADLDAAHIERIRTEEVVTARWRPGILASSFVAVVGALTAPVNHVFGLAMLLVTGALIYVLILQPRRALAKAMAEETLQLSRVGATSYLGLHLRRLEDPENDSAQQELAVLARERTLAMVAWKELVGHLDPADADGMEAEIRGHALRFNATMRAEHSAALAEELATAGLVRDDAQSALRAAANDLQRRLDAAREDAARATASRDELLAELGIEPGPDANEAVAQRRVVAMQRQRVREQSRNRPDIEAERSELIERVRELDRPGWDGPPPMPPSSAAVSLLRRRRDELRSRLGLVLPDSPGGRDAQIAALSARVDELEARYGDPSGARESVPKRLLARLARARDGGDGLAEVLPVILDDPFVRLAVDRRCDLLDMLLRVSARMQLIYVTDDPVVIGWARQQAAGETLMLLEPLVETA